MVSGQRCVDMERRTCCVRTKMLQWAAVAKWIDCCCVPQALKQWLDDVVEECSDSVGALFEAELVRTCAAVAEVAEPGPNSGLEDAGLQQRGGPAGARQPWRPRAAHAGSETPYQALAKDAAAAGRWQPRASAATGQQLRGQDSRGADGAVSEGVRPASIGQPPARAPSRERSVGLQSATQSRPQGAHEARRASLGDTPRTSAEWIERSRELEAEAQAVRGAWLGEQGAASWFAGRAEEQSESVDDLVACSAAR